MARLLTLILLLTACATDRAPDHAAQTDSRATDAAEPDVATQSDSSLIEAGTHPDSISGPDRFIVFGPRRIGYSYDENVRALGPPDVQDGAQSRWSCRVCVVDQQVVLYRTDDRVAAIGFAYYVD